MGCEVCATRPSTVETAIGESWFVSIPAGDAPLTGWITLATREHRETLDELSADEAASLGPLLRSLTSAIRAETGAERTYAANWAEGTRHVHFHIVPRLAGLEPSRLGAAVFALASDDILHPPIAEQERLLASLVAAVARDRNRGLL
ncbi:hypothetical protein [Rhodoglobus aureus]|uniref:HIT domain-containing protein n=1 Tax=Rhodoglobus aureus TaxID=191497 RepID=A0ABN1VL37_9MICO